MAVKRKRITTLQRQILYDMMDGHCGYCGCELEYKAMQIDHVIPLSNGGSDTIDNMMSSCRSCNHRKNSESVEHFRDSVEKFPETLMRDSVTYKNAVRFGLVIHNPHPVEFYFEKRRRLQC